MTGAQVTAPGSIAANLARIRETIADACRTAGRPEGAVCLVAASKGQPGSQVRAAADAGQRVFGENYAREMREKRSELTDYSEDLEWHFIGRVQASNAREIATARLVHGVGSLEQARALARQGAKRGTPVAVLLQLSLWSEASKNGFDEAEIRRELQVLREMPGLVLRGFMAMPPPPDEGGVEPRAAFAAVRALRDALAPDLPELSMGMSGDFREAILEGATLVRVGTALFGPRAQPPRAGGESTQQENR